MEVVYDMRQIKMLDCTLRDGGCVNNFNFGNYYMTEILHSIEEAGIEIIEVGYLDSKSGSERDRTQYVNEQVIVDNFLTTKKPGVTYVAMVDYGKFDPDLLQPYKDSSIDGIRLAFHKKDRKKIFDWGRKILDKGYQLFIQPMACLRYSDAEMLDLINDVNTFLPMTTAFYIVDSFGEMRLKEMNRLVNLIDHNLSANMTLGLHSHNNLQLSYSNAITLLNFPTERNLIFDSSIMGMGKGAGNMTTELFAEHLNIYEEKNYKISSLLKVIDEVINQIREKYSWGYSVEYYLSAVNHCTPSYAGHFFKKHMLSIDQVAELLGKISEDKKISFDQNYADELYYEYNSHSYNDESDIKELKNIVEGKNVLIIAPGKSVLSYREKVLQATNKKDTVTIALNNRPIVECNLAFVTKIAVYDTIRESDMKIIVSSNVPVKDDKLMVVNYDSLTHYEGGESDNSTIMLMNLLLKCGVKKYSLAGFDGFSADFDENYYDEALKRPIEKSQAEGRNALIRGFLDEIRKQVELTFITPSKYE